MAKVEGMEAMRRAFDMFFADSQKEIMAALEKGGQEIADRARQAAPKSDPIAGETHIKDSIKVSPPFLIARRAGRRKSVAVVVSAARSKEDQEAAYRAEFGRRPDDRGHPGHQRQPFMFPAYWSVRKRVRDRVARAINKAAKKAAQRHRLKRS